MSDERRQSSVNLDELERQLREASRARMRAQQTADALSPASGTRTSPADSSQSGLPFQGQAGLPLSPAPAPAPSPSPSSPTGAGFRPIQSSQPAQPQHTRHLGNVPPASPREPQPSYQPVSPPRGRDAGSVYSTPNEPLYEQRPTEFHPAQNFSDAPSVLKSDRMGNIYPPIEAQPVAQDQYYSAAAYEEPAESAYDQYTEDQFPRIESERRSGGLLRGVVWLVMIGIIGAGVYFAYPLMQRMVMPNSQTAKAPPLIKPDPNPVKVQPEVQPQSDNSNVQKDIFTRHANEDPKTAQMAPAAEQPVDVSTAAKNAAQSLPNAKPQTLPLVPGTGEPRPVKTVTVRADGSLIAEKSDPELFAKTTPATPKAVSIPSQVPSAGVPVSALPPLPAQPVAQSPDFILDGPVPLPPERMADATVELELPLDAITTPMPSEPAPVSVPTPTEPPVAFAPGKDFAVQFGAPETEAKGNELKARIEKQFAAALTGGAVMVVKGDSNGKPVFRVRAVGYSRDEASAVCQQVAAAGGQCFVSKNN